MAQDLRDRLRDTPVPDEQGARERGWRVVQAAYSERHPVARTTRPAIRLAIAAGMAALVLALALTPAGAKVAGFVDDVVSPGARHAQPAVTHIPGGGSLLVQSSNGPWVVNQDGSKRRLGDYRDAAWSAGGHFAAVAAGHQLEAVEPTGTDAVRWSIASDQRVSHPSWSSSGIKVAYLSGSSLHVVAGDGTGDRLLARRVAGVTPEWQPQHKPLPPNGQVYGPHTNLLAYATGGGRVVVVSVSQGNSPKVLFRSADRPHPEGLTWSSDGKLLVSFAKRDLRTYDFKDLDRYPTSAGMSGGTALRSVAFRPGTHQVAAIATTDAPSGRRSSLLMGRPDTENFLAEQPLSDPGRFSDLAWSPNGDWLLIGWSDADQWLFFNPKSDHVQPVGHISEQFASGATSPVPFPSLAGWCCTALGTSSP